MCELTGLSSDKTWAQRLPRLNCDSLSDGDILLSPWYQVHHLLPLGKKTNKKQQQPPLNAQNNLRMMFAMFFCEIRRLVCGGGLWVGGMRVTPVSHTLIKLLIKLTLSSPPGSTPLLSHICFCLSHLTRLPSLSSLCPPLSLPVVLFPLILLDSFLSLSLSDLANPL